MPMTNLDYEMMRAGAAGMRRTHPVRMSRQKMRQRAEPVVARKDFRTKRLLPVVRKWLCKDRSFANA